jgi:YD repeat-containing protein
MKIKMKLTLLREWMIFLMIIIPFVSFGKIDETKEVFKTQNVLLPSPTAAAFATYGEVPIGRFTGTVQLNVPIYQLTSGSLKVPVELLYSSNGIKVDQVASNVGLGWSLNAGGVITRTVRGKPDEIYPLNIPQNLGDENENSYEFIYLANEFGKNTQPDIFSFNFSGYSGQFIIDENRKVYGIPHQSLKIEPDIFVSSEVEGKIIITTPDGVKYTFGGTNATEQTKNTDSGLECSTNSLDSEEITTAWYLSRIDHPDGSYINFTYTGIYYSYDTSVSQTVRRRQKLLGIPFGCDRKFLIDNVYECINTATIWGCELSEIRTSSGEWMKVKYDSRQDLPGCHRIDEIIIYKPDDSKVKSCKLNYLFSTNNGGLNKLHYGDLGSPSAVQYLKRRMFLEDVIEQDANGKVIRKHNMKYKQPNDLPARLSFEQDHWGYYNDSNNNSFVPDISNSLFDDFHGANREPKSSVSSYGMIEKITYPTGGYSTFQYVMNSQGGNRIEKVISKTDPNAKEQVKKYFYNKYENRTTPLERSVTWYKYNTQTTLTHICEDGPLGPTSTKDVTYYYGHSNSQISLYGTGSQITCFPYVTVSHGENFENGGEEHHFDINLDSQGRFLYGRGYIFSCPFNNHSWNNGNKTNEYQFKIVNGVRVNQLKKVTHFTVDTRNAQEVKAYVISENGELRQHIYSDPNVYTRDRIRHINVMEYSIYSKWKYLEYEEIYTYDDAGGNPVLTRTEYYYDNTDHAQLTKKISQTSKGDTFENRYYYPGDYNLSDWNLTSLKNNFFIGLPIKVLQLKNGELIGSNIYRYNTLGQIERTYVLHTNVPLPVPIHTPGSLDIAAYTMENRLSYYPVSNNIKNIYRANGMVETYLWGYQDKLPIAQVIYSDDAKIFYTSFEEENSNTSNDAKAGKKSHTGTYQVNLPAPGNYELSYWEKKNGEWKPVKTNISSNTIIGSSSGLIDELRLYPVGAQMKTYTYDPPLGITSETDVNGQTSSYIYDNFGRLQIIKDSKGNILQHNDYRYQTEGL